MSAGFTPGPWTVSGVRLTYAPRLGADTRLINVGPDGDWLAMVFFDMKTARGHADARLIAAAPALYDDAEFLCERLREFASELLDDEVARQFYGHVLPALERMEATGKIARGEA